VLEAVDVTKTYGAVRALDGFSLTIAAGEVCGLIGHNGAGKTTFVEVVTGLTRPDSGTVTVAGLPPAKARHLYGLAPQEVALYFSVTVRQNLRLFGGLAGLRGPALRRAIDETAAALGLTEMLDKPVGLLSGGQRRRAQAATALLTRPSLLLLDEPTVGADPATRSDLLGLVTRAAADGAAVLYTTHYLPELVDLGATLAVCSAGRVVERGAQKELLRDLPGHLELSYPDGRVESVTAADPAAELARRLVAGDRPSAIDIRSATLDDLFNSLAVTSCAARS
jgi:ABC-2 type transport system ATP-binding protein